MKNKLPKFLICKNELLDETTYILHTRQPAFLAKVIPTNEIEMLDVQRQISVQVGELNYFIGAKTRVNGQLYWLAVVKFYEIPEIDINAIGTGGLMSRMGDWFFSYLKNKSDE